MRQINEAVERNRLFSLFILIKKSERVLFCFFSYFD